MFIPPKANEIVIRNKLISDFIQYNIYLFDIARNCFDKYDDLDKVANDGLTKNLFI